MPKRFDNPIRNGESSIMRASATVFNCIAGAKPGAIKKTKCGMRKKATIDTTIIKIKKILKTSPRNFCASAVTLPSDIFAERNGISTVIDASEAMQTKIRSGMRKAA